MRKARILRAFLVKQRKFSENRNAWLGREDSNLRMVESKSTALPLGDAPIDCLESSGWSFRGFRRQRRSIEGVEPFQQARWAIQLESKLMRTAPGGCTLKTICPPQIARFR